MGSGYLNKKKHFPDNVSYDTNMVRQVALLVTEVILMILHPITVAPQQQRIETNAPLTEILYVNREHGHARMNEICDNGAVVTDLRTVCNAVEATHGAVDAPHQEIVGVVHVADQ